MQQTGARQTGMPTRPPAIRIASLAAVAAVSWFAQDYLGVVEALKAGRYAWALAACCILHLWAGLVHVAAGLARCGPGILFLEDFGRVMLEYTALGAASGVAITTINLVLGVAVRPWLAVLVAFLVLSA